LAYRCREDYAAQPAADRFDAIVWVSAKRTLLTAGGIQQRQQTFTTLADLYREIATVLEQPAILQADADQRRGLVERALAAQRTLLIVDNLETVDDEELLTFLRELPDPTKAIVTTRHRIDIAYAVRLAGMPEPDARSLMLVEAARKGIALVLTTENTDGKEQAAAAPSIGVLDDLYRKTGGIPLAIVWSIALMSMGYSVESVLRRLGSGHSDIARFCFAESVAHIRDRDAYRLLLALALFERSVNRQMLGMVAGLGDDIIGRDDGLAELLQLSLIEQKADRFKLLPLTQSYALEELAGRPELEQELRERWVACLTEMARPYIELPWRQPDRPRLNKEGRHLVTLVGWAQQARPDILLPVLPALIYFYDLAGQWTDMLSVGHLGLEYASLLGDRQSTVHLEMFALSWVHSEQGRHDEARRSVANALDIARELGDTAWECEVLVRQSQVLRRSNAIDQALASCHQALRLAEQLTGMQQVYVRADIEYELGKIARDQQRWADARQHFLAARDVFCHDQENPVFVLERASSVLGNLGVVAHQLGHLDEAARLYQQALDFFRGEGGRGYLVTLLGRLAALEEQRGNHTAALDYAREALEWSQKLGMVQEQTQALAIVGRLKR
jgi:LuxR family glucitol operon transcriptional activator